MADINVTTSSVIRTASTVIVNGFAGETLAAGKVVYKQASTQKYFLADANSATEEARIAVGIALNGAAANQPVAIATGGDLTFNAVLTAGIAFFLSDTAGGICPVADIGSGEYVCQVGIAKSTTVLTLAFLYPNVSN